jgi:hypothetical protein
MSQLKLKLKFFYSTREHYQEILSFVFGKVKNGSFCSSYILTSIIDNQIKSNLFNRVINKQQKSNNTFELKHAVIV